MPRRGQFFGRRARATSGRRAPVYGGERHVEVGDFPVSQKYRARHRELVHAVRVPVVLKGDPHLRTARGKGNTREQARSSVKKESRPVAVFENRFDGRRLLSKNSRLPRNLNSGFPLPSGRSEANADGKTASSHSVRARKRAALSASKRFSRPAGPALFEQERPRRRRAADRSFHRRRNLF